MCKKGFKDLNTSLQAKVHKYESEVEVLTNKVEILESSIKSKTHRMEELEKEVDNVSGVFEEKLLYTQMQLNVSKGRDEARDKEIAMLKKKVEEKESAIKGLEAKVASLETAVEEKTKSMEGLQRRMLELEPEVVRLKKNLTEVERHSGMATMLKAEQENILLSLRRDLKNSLDVREGLTKRLAEQESEVQRLTAEMASLHAREEDIESLRTQLDEKSAVVVRLTQEAQTNAAQHALRTGTAVTGHRMVGALFMFYIS